MERISIIKNIIPSFLFMLLFSSICYATPSISTISGTLSHGQSVTITGSGFGTKLTASPLVWDNCSGTKITDKWTGGWPNAASNTTYNLSYRTPIRNIPLPHPHVTKYMAGAHAEGTSYLTGANVIAFKAVTVSSYPMTVYFSAYVRMDDNWVFNLGSPGDNNFKTFDYSNGTSPYTMNSGTDNNWYLEYNDRFTSNTSYGGWHINDDTCAYSCLLQNPDQNGSSWWWNGAVNPFAGSWIKQEYEIRLTDQASGYIKVWENGVQKVNYAGKTSGWTGTNKTIGIGGYARGAGATGSSNNWRYFADLYMDTSAQRVIIGNASTLDASTTLREVQVPTAWSDTSISVNINQGAFADSSSAYLFVIDANGNASPGKLITFGSGSVSSPLPPLDTTAPTASISAPLSGATVSGVQSVSVTASDNVGVTKVELYVDGALAGSVVASPYTFPWNTTGVANGSHVLSAKAYDAAGNIGQSGSVSVTVNNLVADTTTPTVSISSPASAATVTGNVAVNVSATDNVGVARVELYADNATTPIGSATAAPYAFTWNSLTVANGIHTLTVKAYDAAGNTKSASISVTTNNPLPSGTYSAIFGNVAGTNYPNTIEDTFLNINADVNAANLALETYTWPANTPSNSILMKWNLSALPANAVIQSATLYLYMDHMSGTGGDALYEIPVYPIINKSPKIASATGYTYDGTNSWTSNSVAYGGVPLAQADIGPVVDAPLINTAFGYKTWNVTSLVSNWVTNPSSNLGMLLNGSSKATADSNRGFVSSEATDTTKRPYLVVTYKLGIQAPTGLIPTKVTP